MGGSMSVPSPRSLALGLSREKSITQNSNGSNSIPAVPLPLPIPVHVQVPNAPPATNNTAACLSVDSDSDDSYWDLDVGFAPQAAVFDVTAAKTWHPNNSTSGRRSVDLREYHAIDSSDYVLPSDETEQSRVELEHYMLRHVFKNDIVCPPARALLETTSNAKVLDVGCAKGFWLDSVQKVYPEAEYHGVDIAETILERPQAPRQAKIVFGNVLEHLPYDDNTFDYVHQRLLSAGIPKHCFVPVIAELIRVTKPGGFIELVEADMILANMGPKSSEYNKLFHEALSVKANFDALAGTNLSFYVKVQGKKVGKKGIRAARVPLNWNGPIGTMASGMVQEGLNALSDWLHTSFSMSRDEYQAMVAEFPSEWTEYQTVINYHVVYFQVAAGRNV